MKKIATMGFLSKPNEVLMKQTKGLLASLLTIASIVMPTLAFAQQQYANDNECCIPVRAGEPLCGVPEIYPAYAGADVDCGWDVFAFGEYLWWKPYGTGQYFYVSENANNPPSNNIKYITEDWNYRSGFHVGAGMVLHDFDDWVFNVDYLRYHHNFSSDKSVTAPFTLRALVQNNGLTNTYNALSITTGYDWDIVNLNIQRPFYLGKSVIMNPFFGLKWLGQELSLSQTGTRTTGGKDFQEDKLHSSMIGPDAGVDGHWLIGWGFYLLGKADLAILYNYNQKLRRFISLFAPVPAVTVMKGSTTAMEIFGKGGLGLGWNSYFWDCRLRANLAISYDMLVDIKSSASLPFLGANPNQAYLQGLTVTGQIDF